MYDGIGAVLKEARVSKIRTILAADFNAQVGAQRRIVERPQDDQTSSDDVSSRFVGPHGFGDENSR
eukprot:2753326-Pyramimonas_sp.AAC.1